MALEHNFYLDTPASRYELRDALVQANIDFEANADWKNTSGAITRATNVTILDELSHRFGWPDNGVRETCRVNCRDRKAYLSKPETGGVFETESVRGIVALLKAYPEADAYWEAFDAALPVLLRRDGRLVLSQELSKPEDFWGTERFRKTGRQPSIALVDLPYTVEPLGPWSWVSA